MEKKPVFYLCEKCKNLAGMIFYSGAAMTCCGEEMDELEANTADASAEKHVPVAVAAGNNVSVKVGSVLHPMVKEHLVEWVFLQTENGGQRKLLAAGSSPEVEFSLAGDKALAAYAYCNIHGLWKADVK